MTENLLKWLQSDEQCDISGKLLVKETASSGRGICASEPIASHSNIIKIPLSKLLNTSTIIPNILSFNPEEYRRLPDVFRHIKVEQAGDKEENEIIQLYKSMRYHDLLKLTSFQMIGMYLCLEQKRLEQSVWRHFIAMLPTIEDFQLIPMVWKFDGLEELFSELPPTAQHRANNMYKKFLNDYETVVSFINQYTANSHNQIEITKLQFLVSWLCINSRCLYMELPQSKTNEDNFTMAPFVDFLNHSATEQCVLKISNRTGFNVITSSRYEAEDEVFLSYGPHSNEFLLCEYGFYLGENQWNDLDISSDLISLMDETAIAYLKEVSYYNEYTLTETDVSFRTQIALAVIEEQSGNLYSNKRLSSFINGIIDESVYEKRIKRRLGAVLRKQRERCEEMAGLVEEKDAKRRAVGWLYANRLRIIDAHLER